MVRDDKYINHLRGVLFNYPPILLSIVNFLYSYNVYFHDSDFDFVENYIYISDDCSSILRSLKTSLWKNNYFTFRALRCIRNSHVMIKLEELDEIYHNCSETNNTSVTSFLDCPSSLFIEGTNSDYLLNNVFDHPASKYFKKFLLSTIHKVWFDNDYYSNDLQIKNYILLKNNYCRICSRSIISLSILEKCEACSKNPHKFTAEKDMLPNYQHNDFQELTMTGKALISKKQTVTRIHFSTFCRRLGGNVILVENDVNIFCSPISLPRSASDSGLIFFFKPGEVLIKDNIFSAHRDIMYNALIYLVVNHPSYENIIINLENIQTRMNLLDNAVQTVEYAISEQISNFLTSTPGFVNYSSTSLPSGLQTPQMYILAIIKPNGDVENRVVCLEPPSRPVRGQFRVDGGFLIIFLSFCKWER